ncbi:MAG: mRNA 3'-end processing factor [Halobellus sp.]|uniref:mRNA 3'-end processing factor n=1 Tax=Halobellus sp. TaxID=1979212 RepID=UPI0035D4EABC
MTVRLRDGVEITLSDGTRVVCDADDPGGDVAVVTHAHGDHLPEGEATAVCSPLTAALGTARRDAPLGRVTDDRIDLLPAGHVAGSRVALVTDPDGTRYCYTGDVCLRARDYLDGFDPDTAGDVDVLVTEATYGDPGYAFPPHDEVVADALAWLDETDAPVLLFGYALGRAQTLQRLAARAGRRVLTTDAVLRVNDPITTHLDVAFDADEYDSHDLGPTDALVLPLTSARAGWIDRLRDATGALAAGFSGWAVDDSFRFRGNYDVTFPLSDHADFPALVSMVDALDPDRVYTQHGEAATLATRLTRRGYDATALRDGQSTLGEF